METYVASPDAEPAIQGAALKTIVNARAARGLPARTALARMETGIPANDFRLEDPGLGAGDFFYGHHFDAAKLEAFLAGFPAAMIGGNTDF